MFVRSDLHIHTTLSRCCRDTRQKLENIVPILAGRGMKRLGISDHFWVNDTVPAAGFYLGQDGSRLLALREQLCELCEPVDVLLGGEAEMRAPGVFGVTPEFREKLDYVLLATDHFHLRDFVEQPEKKTPRGIAEHMLKFFRNAAVAHVADVLVHPMCPLGFLDQYDHVVESLSDSELEDAFALAAENDAAIELNAALLYPMSPRQFQMDTAVRVYALARRAGCKFTFGSDAHALAAFDALPKLGRFADRIGLTTDDLAELAQI